MKTHNKNCFLLCALIVGLGWPLAGQLKAQTLTTLYTFSALDAATCTINSDGANPSELVLSGNTLYGAAGFGGPTGDGTLFAVNTDGSGFTTLWTFSALNPNTNSDGADPFSGFALGSNILYGVTFHGGPSGVGTMFSINTDGTDFGVIHAFTKRNGFPQTNYDGENPMGGLILSGNTLYGTTYYGGLADAGIVFKVNTDGTGFTNLHNFSTLNNPGGTNSDGGNPAGFLTLSGNTLYGMAHAGGKAARGTLFKVNTDGTGFAVLHSFSATVKGTNSDGGSPGAELTLSGSVLYGTAGNGGEFGGGAIFQVNTNGTGFKILYNFASPGGPPFFSNGGGAGPDSPLVLSGNTFFGLAGDGGSSGAGTLFTINTNGTGFTTLYNFSGGNDGANPDYGLISSGDTLYGTTYNGGAFGSGTVFSFSLEP